MKRPSWLMRANLISLALALFIVPFVLQSALAAPPVINWAPADVRSKAPSVTAAYPDVAYDASGNIHIGWIEYAASDTEPSRVMYTNNVGGSWLTPYEVSGSASRGAEPLLSIAVESNRVHFLYITNGTAFVSHRYVTLSGATPTKSSVTTMSSDKGANPELTADPSGKIHGFWISRETGQYLVKHRIWANGSWEAAAARVVRNDGVLQKFPKAAVTNDGRIHLTFLSSGAFRYYIFNGSAWGQSTNIASGSVKQISLASNGSTIYALYTAQPGNFHNAYFVQGSNGSWSTPVLLSSGASYDEQPNIVYSSVYNMALAFWISGPDPQNTSIVMREFNGAAFSDVKQLGGIKAAYPVGASGSGSVSVVWQDKVTGTYAIHHRIGTTGPVATPTPIATAVPTTPPVDFTFNRITPAQSTNANVGVEVTNLLGSPNEMRFSLTPFGAGDGAPAWQALQTGFNVNTAPGVVNCGVSIYAQVRNSSNGQVSQVKSVSAVIDSQIQAVVNLSSMENAPGAQRPADVSSEQPHAPNGGDASYTRASNFYYSFIQEPGPCVGIKSYKVETFAMAPSPMPYFVTGFAPFNPFNSAPDTNGVGLPEQTLVANLVLTDTLNTKAEYTKTIFYDDDPPVLSQGGSITFPNGASTDLSLVPLQFTATVTDDGYTNSAPADKKYWGVWVVATNSQTMPDPQVFAQYGKVHAVEPGANTVANVNLTNDYNQESPTPALRQAGERYIHIRFLDGAGNYSTTGLTSPPITLTAPFVDGVRSHLPVIAK